MIKNSIYRIFSIIRNCDNFLKKYDFEFDLNHLLYYAIFQKQPKFLIKIYTDIYNDVENNLYTLKDLKIACLYQLLFAKKIKLPLINYKNVNNIKKIFTVGQLEKDKKIIIEQKSAFVIKDIKEYFKLYETGKSLCYNLIESNAISLVFWLKYGYLFENLLSDKFYQESKEHYKFRMVAKRIKQIILNKEE